MFGKIILVSTAAFIAGYIMRCLYCWRGRVRRARLQKLAATKSYVDTLLGQLDIKEPVRLKTDKHLPCIASGFQVGKTLTAKLAGVGIIGGEVIAWEDRILVKDQENPIDNGVFIVTDSGSDARPFVLTRASDFDTDENVMPGATLSHFDREPGETYCLHPDKAVSVDVAPIIFLELVHNMKRVEFDAMFRGLFPGHAVPTDEEER